MPGREWIALDKIGLFRTMRISAAGMSVQRMKLETIAENLANAETTRTEEGGPYKRKTVSVELIEEQRENLAPGGGRFADLLSNRFGSGFHVKATPPAQIPKGGVAVDEETPFTLRYDPGHPDADEDGIVKMPNVNVIDEMVDMITATRAYEANVTALQAAKDMFIKALEI
jgi:flagellar basal-body rod protein FlgC